MSTTEFYIQILLVAIALFLDIMATRKLIRSNKLIPKVKIINIVLTWLIPYVWASLVLSSSDKPLKKTGEFDSNRYMDSGYPGP